MGRNEECQISAELEMALCRSQTWSAGSGSLFSPQISSGKNSLCFGVAVFCGSNLSDLDKATCGQFCWHLWVRVMYTDGQRWSIIDPMVGRILHSSSLRSRSEVLFSSLRNKLLSGNVVANAHFANLNFFKAYQAGFCGDRCTRPYGCGFSGCVKWD